MQAALKAGLAGPLGREAWQGPVTSQCPCRTTRREAIFTRHVGHTCFIMAQIFSRMCNKDPLSHSSITMLVFKDELSAANGSAMLKRLRGSSVSTA